MSELNLPACPICHAKDSLSRQTMERAGQPFVWYECRECGSVLLWMGDDRWAYQKVGREDKAHLLKQPMTASELRMLLPSVEEEPTVLSDTEVLADTESVKPVEVPARKARERGKPTRLLMVSLAVTILGFIVALVLLLSAFPSGGEPALTSSIPTPAFSAGMDVRLVAPYGDSVPVFQIKEGDCGFRFRNSNVVPRGERATILDGICYREKNHDYYYEVKVAGVAGWVREGLVIPVDLYTPVATKTPLPTIAPAAPSYVDRCVGTGSGVAYVIEGKGVSRVTLTMQNDNSGTNQGEYSVPFCKIFTGFRSGDFLYISAQIVKGGGTIRCRIYDGSQIIASANASGFASIATCHGSAR